jgi:lipid-binding SYLF domain-containing protein
MDQQMSKVKSLIIILCSLTTLNLIGCRTVPKTVEKRNVLTSQVDEAITAFKKKSPRIERYFDTSYGYAVFPKVGKVAFVGGGAYGMGQMFVQNELIGYIRLTQASAGFSFGVESFREIIFFETKESLEKFQIERYALAAQVSGTAFRAGMAAKTDYGREKKVFIMTENGLMIDASVAGQKFRYVPFSRIGYETNRYKED